MPRASRRVPTWARRLINRVCRDHGVPIPDITWSRSRRHQTSSGRHIGPTLSKPGGRIHVTAGTSRKDAHYVVLHELAHHIVGNGEKHSRVFYAMQFALVSEYGGSQLGMYYAKKRSSWYKPRNSKAGYRLYRQRIRDRAALADRMAA